jgi:hypothetical protein
MSDVLLGTYTPPATSFQRLKDASFVASVFHHTVEVTTDMFLVRLRKAIMANDFRHTLLVDTTMAALAEVAISVLDKGFARTCPPAEQEAYIGVLIHKLREHQARIALEARSQ